jgi:formylmethanofuran dehydrogenase subunit E
METTCEECGEVILEDYQPSNFCQECVERFLNKRLTRATIHPEFHQ